MDCALEDGDLALLAFVLSFQKNFESAYCKICILVAFPVVE